MPQINGIETIKLLRNNSETSHIPIIMAKGKMLQSEDLQLALQTGAFDYLRKPIDKIELIARIQSIILHFETLQKNRELERIIHQQREKETKRVLEQNKHELSLSSIHLQQNMQVFNYIISTLLEFKKTCKKDKIKQIDKFISEIKTNIKSVNWKQFELIFNKVHPSFLKKIIQLHPTLSQNEIRLCNMLKMNMTNKEISAISLQTYEAIKKTRFRLRRKLKLKTDESLINYLQQIV